MKPPSSLDLFASIHIGCRVTTSDLPKHSCFRWFRALTTSIWLTRSFDRGGSNAAERVLQHVRIVHDAIQKIPCELQILKARRDAALLRSMTRLLVGARACFAESFALCAGLRRLGFASDVVVGYAQMDLSLSTPLHAWVECQGKPVTDSLEVLYCYIEVQRYGEHRPTPLEEKNEASVREM